MNDLRFSRKSLILLAIGVAGMGAVVISIGVFTGSAWLAVSAEPAAPPPPPPARPLEIGLGGTRSAPLEGLDGDATPPPWPPLALLDRLRAAPTGGQAAAAVPFADLITRSAARHGLDPRLLAAVIRAESDFDPAAVSPRGARGLMQVMPDTARRFGASAERLFEPEINVEVGSRYLRWLLDRYPGRLDYALAAYNAGEGAVEAHGDVPPFAETRLYVQRVHQMLEEFRRP